jgi:pilus assembly protein Flp/PilA
VGVRGEAIVPRAGKTRAQSEERKATIRKFLKDETGATAIEYGLIAALVAVACIVALEAMGSSLRDLFTAVKGKLEGAKTQSC